MRALVPASILAALLTTGCLAPSGSDTSANVAPEGDDDPLAATFRLSESLAAAADGEAFADANPFGYENPFR